MILGKSNNIHGTYKIGINKDFFIQAILKILPYYGPYKYFLRKNQ